MRLLATSLPAAKVSESITEAPASPASPEEALSETAFTSDLQLFSAVFSFCCSLDVEALTDC